MNSLSLFEFRNNKYNIRNFQVLSTEFRRTVNYGFETITYRAAFFWANLQLPLKNLNQKLRNGNVTHVTADYEKYFN